MHGHTLKVIGVRFLVDQSVLVRIGEKIELRSESFTTVSVLTSLLWSCALNFSLLMFSPVVSVKINKNSQ